MKISQNTIDIFKNYATINSMMKIDEGSILRTIAQTKTIMAIANIPEVFPREVNIYDLNIFLGTLALFDEPDIDFKEKFMVISEGKEKSKSITTKYFYAHANVMTGAQSKDIKMPQAFISFKFDKNDYDKLVKASATLTLDDFAVESDGERISLSVFDKKNNKGTNRFSIDVGEGNGDKYQMIIKVKNLKMIPGTYDVQIAEKAISQFKNVDKDISYFIALDSASKKG